MDMLLFLSQCTQPAASANGDWAATLVAFYAENLRGSLFAGFLTLGGFLFSAKTFIVVKMKEGVYDTDGYTDRLEILRRDHPDAEHYAPLKRLTGFLFYTVLMCLVTAVAQLTLGLLPHWMPVAICLCLSVITVVLLCISLKVVNDNLKEWFVYEEQQRLSERNNRDG